MQEIDGLSEPGLVLAYAVIGRRQTPDWDAGRRSIEAMCDEEAEEIGDSLGWPECSEESAQEVRERLRGDVDILAASARLVWMEARDVLVVAAGGMSYGSSPTLEYDAMQRLDDSGLLAVIGFDGWRSASSEPSERQER